MSKNRNNRQKRRKSNRPTSNKESTLLYFRKSYPRDVVTTLELPCTLISLTTNGSSTITTMTTIDRSIIQSDSAAIVTQFLLYRIRQVKVDITPVSTSAGVTKFFWYEAGSTPTTSTMAQAAKAITLPNNSASPVSKRTLYWSPGTIEDVQFEETTSGNKVWIYFGAYTDSTYGSPQSTLLFQLNIRLVVDLKGLGV